MKIKQGVRVHGISPEILLAAIIADQVYTAFNQEAVITSAIEGKHSTGSLHYAGNAIDLRTRTLEEQQVRTLATQIKLALSEDYDVVVERDHLHIEFQPKQAY